MGMSRHWICKENTSTQVLCYHEGNQLRITPQRSRSACRAVHNFRVITKDLLQHCYGCVCTS